MPRLRWDNNTNHFIVNLQYTRCPDIVAAVSTPNTLILFKIRLFTPFPLLLTLRALRTPELKRQTTRFFFKSCLVLKYKSCLANCLLLCNRKIHHRVHKKTAIGSFSEPLESQIDHKWVSRGRSHQQKSLVTMNPISKSLPQYKFNYLQSYCANQVN